ncbi:MAG: hypothetical protein HC898_01290 [Phycisphaerales bacterium]|nr:hypothetical protein [Phycisphaerales bacterium]
MVLGMLAWSVGNAHAQIVERLPRLAYVYPAGGQQGTTIDVLVGGQFIQGCNQVHVNASGVTAKIVEKYRPLRLFSLEKEQRDEMHRRLVTLVQLRWEEMHKQGLVDGRIPWTWALRAPTPALDDEKPVELPKHPLLVDWEKKSLRELIYLRESLTTYQRRQQNQQLDESIRLELTIAKDTQPGIYEIRMVGSQGLTNPLLFVVGMLPETSEIENNDPGEELPIPADKPLALPLTINGQIMAGDVDRIRFQAVVGQQLVVQVQARTLIPFLADAVPGWVQPVLAIYDPQGREIGFADDHQYHPDPLLRFKVPATGIYELEIRDALYRGREDFVYRMSIGELPIITAIHPLGGRADELLTVTMDGWNLLHGTTKCTLLLTGNFT